MGMRSYAVAGPDIWNSLPAALRTATLSPLAFARRLKNHLTACLRTILDALYKSAHHHCHHHHIILIVEHSHCLSLIVTAPFTPPNVTELDSFVNSALAMLSGSWLMLNIRR